ncbi:GPW/gp25 family protein [Ruminiclostridium cellulolyticum]|uniref:GPW/gp25 family protein n=1 Tax=Ruminiclostridium cellulolyticum (strain ATCC 35319 / DSM 5812 / JCM 6584 / H10) TaxID=394503 RepID=B8I237_RUMCH|nr:GPW/gp25 family protein [Ruminiclostridium cellulolyticum]ACL75863.1 GPW/gp25 family protein [Ruminiclostridium cellulolyticum H10]
MEVIDFLGKGLRYPVSAKKSKLCTSVGEESIKESIMLILGTSRGERVMRPDFGCRLNDMLFSSNELGTATLIQTYVEEALLNWEPRIEVESVTATMNQTEPIIEINVDYIIKSSNSKANLVYPFYLESVGR